MVVQYILGSDGFLAGIYEGTDVQANSTTLKPMYTEGLIPRFLNGAWVDQANLQTPAAIRIAEIEAELTAIDAASARPLRAILTATTSGGTADPTDVAKLADLEAQAKALREELAALAT